VSVSEPKRIADFDSELKELDSVRESAIGSIIEAAPGHRLLINQADWHLRGLNYHLARILKLYQVVAQEVGDRAAGDPSADVIIMYSPDMQDLMFEFHAFISLARITFDQLQRFVAPSLAAGTDPLPSSVTEIVKGHTDHPVYVRLVGRDNQLLRYLLDIRDCLVHHRTFATSDNTIAVREGFPENKLPDLAPMWFRPVVRTYFRKEEGIKVVVNVSLPDAIYAYTRQGERAAMLPAFTYERVNLLSQTREFAKLCTSTVLTALSYIPAGGRYTYKKRRRHH
jgi:hypothetical protein